MLVFQQGFHADIYKVPCLVCILIQCSFSFSLKSICNQGLKQSNQCYLSNQSTHIFLGVREKGKKWKRKKRGKKRQFFISYHVHKICTCSFKERSCDFNFGGYCLKENVIWAFFHTLEAIIASVNPGSGSHEIK